MIHFFNFKIALNLTNLFEMHILEKLLSEANESNNIELVKELLYLCDKIYYIGRDVYYEGVAYGLNDLPPDSFFDMMWKKYMKDARPGAELTEDLLNEVDAKVKNSEYIMYTLEKFRRDDFTKGLKLFKKYDKLFISAKMDGLSLQCKFIDGKLVQALTRYQKDIGIDCTRKALRFITYPDIKKCPKELVVSGEVLIKGDGYKQIKNEKGDFYKTRRATASGIMNRKYKYDGDDEILKNLYFVAFDCPYAEGHKFDTEEDKFNFLKSLSFEVPSHEIITKDNFNPDYLEQKLLDYKKMYKKIFDVDGIVICPLKYEWENIETPVEKISFKLKFDEIANTEVIQIEWRVKRTGNIVPVIKIKPVTILNTNVKSITGANASIIEDNQIMVGSIVGVIKSQEIIPHIETVDNSKLPKDQKATIPDKCPLCESNTSWKQTEKGEGRMLICPNNLCPSRYQNVPNFFKILGLTGYSEKSFENMEITSIEEAYELEINDIANMEGFALKSATDFYNQIREIIKNVNQSTYLAACSIDGIKEKVSDSIIQVVNIDKLFCLNSEIPKTYDEWLANIPTIPGVKTKFRKIYDNLKWLKYITLYLFSIGMTFKENKPTQEKDQISGKKFVLTGKGNKTRDEYVDLIEGFGGKVVGTISGKTDYLVTNDPHGAGNKNRDAKEYGVSIITYDILDKWLA